MPPDQPAGSPQGTPPQQNTEGTIQDQSLLNQDQGTTKTAADDANKDQSLLNQKTEPPVDPKAKDGDAKPKSEPTGAPDKYELKTPEGFEVSEDVITSFKAAGLNNEAAQKMVDLHVAKVEAAMKTPYDLWQQTQEKWVKEIKADPEIGGKLDQVRAVTAKAIDSLGPELAKSFREALNFTGAGNNPTFVKAFYKMAQQLTEGTHVSGGGPVINAAPGSSERPSAAQALYPNLK